MTKKQIAIEVLMKSRAARKWAAGEASFMELYPGLPGYDEFMEKAKRKWSERMVR